MSDHQRSFELVRRLVRLIPDIRGKQRVARLALRPFRRYDQFLIPDRYGNRFYCPSIEEPIAQALFADGVYEPGTVAVILSRLPSNGIYLDVGANIGAIAFPVARQRPDARIICVEADPSIAAILRRNATENRLSNITIIECLAGPCSKDDVQFYSAPTNQFGMGSVGKQFGLSPKLLKQVALDQCLDRMGVDHVDVIKLDVEGAELGVLQGVARRLINTTSPPTIVFEFSDWAEQRIEGQSAGAAQAYLRSLGYHIFKLERRGMIGAPLDQPISVGGAMLLAQRQRPATS
jgi:FkbM family methyltransferase